MKHHLNTETIYLEKAHSQMKWCEHIQFHEEDSQSFHCLTFSLKGPGTEEDHIVKSGKGPVTARKFSPFLSGILFQLTCVVQIKP